MKNILLPERKPVEPLEFNRTTADVDAIAHNACLDEVARLNQPASAGDDLTASECACGDQYHANSYGAGFMAANNGVCENCDAANSCGRGGVDERAAFYAGVKAASDKVKSIVADYDERHGSTDPDTGTREYPGNGEEWVGQMLELIEDFTGIVAPAALSAPNHSEQVRHMVPAWNLAADELPASGKTVLAFYLNSHGMGRRIRAMHVKRFTVEAEEFADPDTQCCEYSEQDDCYYTTEGWYELIDNWPDYSSCAVIEGVVTHWMPLPSAPSAGSQEKG